MTVDPFALHPNLRDLILDSATSEFRSLTTAGVAERLQSNGMSTDWLRSDTEREALRRAFLKGHSGDLWVFAYGSLMWDPALHFSQVRRAHVPGYARRMILRDINGGRGTPEAPGLMAALDHGPEGCDGLVFRLDADRVEAETTVLWQREMIGHAYSPAMVPATTRDGPVTCLTFIADHTADSMDADLTRAEQVRYIATGAGFLGTSLEYLQGIARQFKALGIDDPAVSSLLAEAEALAISLA